MARRRGWPAATASANAMLAAAVSAAPAGLRPSRYLAPDRDGAPARVQFAPVTPAWPRPRRQPGPGHREAARPCAPPPGRWSGSSGCIRACSCGNGADGRSPDGWGRTVGVDGPRRPVVVADPAQRQPGGRWTVHRAAPGPGRPASPAVARGDGDLAVADAAGDRHDRHPARLSADQPRGPGRRRGWPAAAGSDPPGPRPRRPARSRRQHPPCAAGGARRRFAAGDPAGRSRRTDPPGPRAARQRRRRLGDHGAGRSRPPGVPLDPVARHGVGRRNRPTLGPRPAFRARLRSGLAWADGAGRPRVPGFSVTGVSLWLLRRRNRRRLARAGAAPAQPLFQAGE